jgi:Fe-Mn family superoxide dismutase
MNLKELLDLDGNLYELLPLPYEYDALEPHIDKETMIEHHTKHQAKYVENLNKELEDTPSIALPIEEIMKKIESYSQKVRNNVGGVWNHTFFWPLLGTEETQPNGNLELAIIKQFGSVEDFKNKFKEVCLTKQFGSGWVWLSEVEGQLKITITPNQDNPLMYDEKPIIGIDLWEHSFYLKHKSNKGAWVDTFLEILDWNQAEKNHNQ